MWRGENTQRGRYREFMQCDFDTIGSESVTVDAEAVLVIHDLLRALGIEDFAVHVNNRMVLTGVLARLGLADRAGAVLRALDKLAKIGPEKVAEEMNATAGATPAQAREVLALASLNGANEDIIGALHGLVAGDATAERGVANLVQVLHGARAAGIPEDKVRIDLSIARGLDYYTGTVFETYLGALPAIGSICSGGRYDDLAQLYTKERLPGVGASLGLDRLLAALEELKLVESRRASAPVFLAFFDAAHWGDYLALAARLRAHGVGVELYPECKKLGVQLKYADRRGFPVALVVGADEWKASRCQLKTLSSGESRDLALYDASGALSAELVRALAEWKR